MALCLKVIRTLLAPLGFFELYMHGLAKEKRRRNLLALVALQKKGMDGLLNMASLSLISPRGSWKVLPIPLTEVWQV